MDVLWLVPAFPLAGFLVLALFGRSLRGRSGGVVGSVFAGLSMLSALFAAAFFIVMPPVGDAYTLTLWSWFSSGGLTSSFAFRLDALSVAMILVVTVVGFLIHLFSIEHMVGEEGYPRFFAYMNLFVSSMLILVLADNLVLLYLGWEGVGLCSYLLIGFWYRDPANGLAARKAFIVTRVGDVSLLVGIFLVAQSLGSFGIQESAQRALTSWPVGSPTAIWAAALILGGALGKSAQLPLQTWLPDAMAGPSPVSALIHAATMVTAGVYLVARTHVIFSLAPPVLLAVGVIGALTLLVAGASAIVQTDIKRVLAYSTMSQIGYMFLALGVGAWTGAIFHLVTHAFFKSLLFLAAGVIINALHHEHDIRRMGGLARRMPFVFWIFLIGAFGLSALPPVSSGFASKDAILAAVWESGHYLLYAAGLAGAFLTSIYTFRLLFLVFGDRARNGLDPAGHGEEGRLPTHSVMAIPLIILAVLCLFGGLLDFPSFLGGVPFLSTFLGGALPFTAAGGSSGTEALLSLVSLAVVLLGIPFGRLLARRSGVAFRAGRAEPGLGVFLKKGWLFDSAYAFLFQRPFEWIARINRRDIVDRASEGFGAANLSLSLVLRRSQTGRIRLYVAALALGAALIVAAAVFL